MILQKLHEIRSGRSKFNKYWLKHPSLEDEAKLEELNEKFLQLAIKRKIPLEAEAVIAAEKMGTWTTENERDLASSEAYLVRLKTSYEKVIEGQKKYIKDDLDAIIPKVVNLKLKKNKAIGRTAEDWAFTLSHERYILSLFFKDEKLTERLWENEEIEMLEQEDFNDSILCFVEFKKKFADEELKSIACANFVQNLYYLAGGSNNFFKANVFEMSSIQQRLVLFLENYKNIISNISGKVPENVLSDWKELDKWVKASERSREEIERKWSGKKDDKINYESIQRASMASDPLNEGVSKETRELLS